MSEMSICTRALLCKCSVKMVGEFTVPMGEWENDVHLQLPLKATWCLSVTHVILIFSFFILLSELPLVDNPFSDLLLWN